MVGWSVMNTMSKVLVGVFALCACVMAYIVDPKLDCSMHYLAVSDDGDKEFWVMIKGGKPAYAIRRQIEESPRGLDIITDYARCDIKNSNNECFVVSHSNLTHQCSESTEGIDFFIVSSFYANSATWPALCHANETTGKCKKYSNSETKQSITVQNLDEDPDADGRMYSFTDSGGTVSLYYFDDVPPLDMFVVTMCNGLKLKTDDLCIPDSVSMVKATVSLVFVTVAAAILFQ